MSNRSTNGDNPGNSSEFTKSLESIRLHRCFPQVQIFLNETKLLFENDVTNEAIYIYLSREINRLHLYNVHPYDVLLEGIERGVKYIIINEKPINIPKAWLRKTTQNILLEYVRAIKGCFQMSDEIANKLDCSDSEQEEASFDENPTLAWQAFRSLSKPEQRIIIYKLFQNKNYSEICELASYQNHTQTALRAQYSRAIKKLRKNFKQLVNGAPL
jgi:RNA polymerase sigma factor (sigma-70 family)